MDKKKKFTRRFTTSGVVLGFIIHFFIIKGFLYAENQSFLWENFANLHNNSIFYLVDLIPIFMGLFGFFIGNFFESRLIKLTSEIEDDHKRKNSLLDITKKLSLGEIDFDIDEDNADSLVKNLVELRDNLQKKNEAEKTRKKEDDQRHWIAEGLAKFGEILRHNNDNIETLSYEIISKLAKYINAVQGGFYILDDSEKNNLHFKLTAHFAYDRKKYNEKRIEWGEGLIGRSAFECKTLYIDEIPQNYVEITSGLGEANPSVLLIVPLKFNDEVHGVIEFANFNRFEKFQIDFIEKIAESIGSTLSNVKINMQTAKLLGDSQEQAERLSQQEEEMRQNMEELQATQEEAAKQSKEFVSFTNSVNHTLIRAEYDVNGILIYANTKFLKKLEYKETSEVEGHHISMFINEKDKEWFNEIWNDLARGGRHFEGYMKHVTKKGQDLWTMATYTCVRNEEGGVEKILFLAIDTTEHKKQSLDFEGQIKALNIANIKAEFAPSGKFVNCNDLFVESVGYSLDEVKERSIFDYFDEENIATFEEVWNNVVNGIPHKDQFNVKVKDNKVKWFQMTFMAVNNMYEEVDRILILALDITDQKELEIKINEQNRQLKIQEEKLKNSEIDLQQKLDKAKRELRQHFKEIEKSKIRNEKTLEGSLDSIITINQNGIVEFFNKAAETLWGYERDEVIGKNVSMLFNKESIENNDFVAKFVDPKADKIVGERQEITISAKSGDQSSVLIMLADATVDKIQTFTAFIQQIEVELF